MVILEHVRRQFFGSFRHACTFDPGAGHSRGFSTIFRSLLLLVLSQAAVAEQLDVLLDLDNKKATGCTLVTPDGLFAGVEQVLRTGYDANQVTGVELLSCLDPATNTLSAPVVVSPGGWPVGSGLGVGGSDVVETAVAFSQLGSPSSTLRLGFATLDRLMLPADALLTDSGADILLSLSGGSATPVPTLQELGIALLSLLLAAAAFHGYRRNPQVGKSLFTVVIIVAGIGLVWAAIIPDGDPSDDLLCVPHESVGEFL